MVTLLTALCFMQRGTKILVDDYTDRLYKNVMENIIKPDLIIERAAYFDTTPNLIITKEILQFFSFFCTQ